ncbi:glycoside hydrolase family 26 protein [Kocuria rosea]|uniref:glycoside hydrolase family 26 protein n=1 Tax=Kocuria rosea TaxID=1275 RepID=UPI0011A57522|nr:glycosyl hydrolase [Kocuria rosea]WJZ67465.1 glycosyl hydrolase [Kocuria rosea]
MKESSLVAVVFVAALALGGGTLAAQISSQPDEEVQAAPLPMCTVLDRSELEPETGALYGVNLDWDDKPLGDYADRLGHRPAVSVSFTGFPYDERGHDYLRIAADQVRADGRMMLLTLEPEGGLAEVTDEAVRELTADLAAINDSGVPVVVRFAHEMNGSWYAWGHQPTAYVEAYRRVADAVHEHAPGSAMMWAPNYGGGYPFAGGQYEAEPGTADFRALDTDGDGALTMADDPYAPYYPGDDAVDWVGMSLYHWGDRHPWGENELPEPGKFAAQLTGTYDGAGGDDSAVPDFYAEYGQRRGKPVAIPETAALYNPAEGGADELAIKQAWWGQVFDESMPEDFPQLKMISWFEWDKHEVEIDGPVDWTTTNTAAVRDAFTADLPEWLHWGPEESCTPAGS